MGVGWRTGRSREREDEEVTQEKGGRIVFWAKSKINIFLWGENKTTLLSSNMKIIQQRKSVKREFSLIKFF